MGRQLAHDFQLRRKIVEPAVEDALRAQVLDPADAEGEVRQLAAVQQLPGQEMLRPEAQDRAVALDQVHGRRAEEGRDEGVGRIVVGLGGRPDLTDLAVVDHGDAIAHAHGLDLVVGHVDRGRAHFPLELLELVARRGAQLGVEVGERLVEQEDRGLAHQRARQRHPLALAARELAGLALQERIDPEQLRGPGDLAVDLVLRGPLGLQGKGDVAADGEVRVEAVALEHHGDAAAARRHLVDRPAVDLDRARGRLLEPGDDPQKGRLAAARGPEQDHELAIPHRQADAVDRGHVAEQLSDFAGRDVRHRRPSIPAARPAPACRPGTVPTATAPPGTGAADRSGGRPRPAPDGPRRASCQADPGMGPEPLTPSTSCRCRGSASRPRPRPLRGSSCRSRHSPSCRG